MQMEVIMFKRIMKAIMESQQRRADYWILMNMTDRELHDIGIARGQIREVLEGDDVRTSFSSVRA
ncbi:hypothetical protein CRP212_gp47 [Roseobacter phage CRP-212]|nr:hypothetical protein CRP212_gp47 [Roseobacter phage CRP-212]